MIAGHPPAWYLLGRVLLERAGPSYRETRSHCGGDVVRDRRERNMSTRLFVGNLPFHATEELLSTRFAAVGEVKNVSMMLDRETGRSRGFAFIEMGTPEAAKKAIAELHGTDFEGRPLRVDIAQERPARGGGGGGGPGGGGGGGGRGDRGGRRGRG